MIGRSRTVLILAIACGAAVAADRVAADRVAADRVAADRVAIAIRCAVRVTGLSA